MDYTYEAVLVERVPAGVWVPPIVDLTPERSALRAVAADDLDWAVTAASASLPGAVAVWRTWRGEAGKSARERVYLIEASLPVDELPARQAEIAGSVADEEAVLELRSTDAAPSAEFVTARRNSALLWAAEADHRVLIAKAFDGVDPVTGPWFDEGHERLTGDEKDAVLRFLEDTPVLLMSTERMADVFDPRTGPRVSTDHRTDGHWAWTDTVPYYLREHDLAPDPEFLAYIRQSNYTAAEVTHIGRHRAVAELEGTLRANLAVRNGIGDERIHAAVHAAAADDVLTAHPDGLDRELTERGANLSGGQRQRIALARALATDPAVLVVHDPTTSIDAVTEALVADRLAAHRRRDARGTVVITSSPALLRATDRVVVIGEGSLVATGTHDELMADADYRAAVLR